MKRVAWKVWCGGRDLFFIGYKRCFSYHHRLLFVLLKCQVEVDAKMFQAYCGAAAAYQVRPLQRCEAENGQMVHHNLLLEGLQRSNCIATAFWCTPALNLIKLSCLPFSNSLFRFSHIATQAQICVWYGKKNKTGKETEQTRDIKCQQTSAILLLGKVPNNKNKKKGIATYTRSGKKNP